MILNNYEDSIVRMITETGLGRAEIEKIMLIFFESTYGILKDLDLALRKSDYKMIQKISHKIKGASGNLRLDWISKIVDELEISGKNRDMEACNKLTEKLYYHINQYADFV